MRWVDDALRGGRSESGSAAVRPAGGYLYAPGVEAGVLGRIGMVAGDQGRHGLAVVAGAEPASPHGAHEARAAVVDVETDKTTTTIHLRSLYRLM